jgi:hypothetical protein
MGILALASILAAAGAVEAQPGESRSPGSPPGAAQPLGGEPAGSSPGGDQPSSREPAGGLLGRDGHAWRALTEAEKLAFLQGFLTGSAVEHAARDAAILPDLAPEALERMRREGQLRFPFAPAVYKARLEDFYFYQDRLSVPLYRALFLINEQIRQGGR